MCSTQSAARRVLLVVVHRKAAALDCIRPFVHFCRRSISGTHFGLIQFLQLQQKRKEEEKIVFLPRVGWGLLQLLEYSPMPPTAVESAVVAFLCFLSSNPSALRSRQQVISHDATLLIVLI